MPHEFIKRKLAERRAERAEHKAFIAKIRAQQKVARREAFQEEAIRQARIQGKMMAMPKNKSSAKTGLQKFGMFAQGFSQGVLGTGAPMQAPPQAPAMNLTRKERRLLKKVRAQRQQQQPMDISQLL